MPVTLLTAGHSPRIWTAQKVSTAEELLERSSPEDHRRSQDLIQSSFLRSLFHSSHVSASEHGFVWAVFHAYSEHHDLTIRPEDVWFSILTQLSFFVNAHAEELRSFFVAHEGQKELEVIDAGSIKSVDFGALALRMSKLIEDNVLDKELRAWIMPEFSTTTESDRVVAAILMMGTMKKYFSYRIGLMWNTLGNEPARFAQLLRPILNHFVASFDSPSSPAVLDFWSKCAHRGSMSSGSDYLSGWISVFCFWDEDGKLLCPDPIHPTSSRKFEERNTAMRLDDAFSRHVDTGCVPSRFTSVSVTVDDNGDVHDAVMLAGLVGIQVTSSGAMLDGTRDHSDSHSFRYGANGKLERVAYTISPPTEQAGLDSIQPLSGWWMYEKTRAAESEGREAETENYAEENEDRASRMRGLLDGMLDSVGSHPSEP